MTLRLPLVQVREERCVLAGPEDPALGRPVAVLVAMAEDGTPRAYRNECMHIAIPLGLFADSILDRGTLLCGTHGARYQIDDGMCVEGPCVGIALDALPARIEGDDVVVDD